MQDKIQGGSDGNDWTALTDIRRDTDSVSLSLFFPKWTEIGKTPQSKSQSESSTSSAGSQPFQKTHSLVFSLLGCHKGRDASLFWDVFQILLVVVVFYLLLVEIAVET